MTGTGTDIQSADDSIAALRLALVRLDLDSAAHDIRIGDGVVWSLCDLAALGFARAHLAESFLTGEQREEHDRAPVDLDEWRDVIRTEMTGLIETLTLTALDPGEPG